MKDLNWQPGDLATAARSHFVEFCRLRDMLADAGFETELIFRSEGDNPGEPSPTHLFRLTKDPMTVEFSKTTKL